jgi:outer membrane protein assembly factor BamB
MVVAVAALALLVTGGLMTLTLSSAHEVARRRDSTEAFFAADAGLEAGKLAFERTNQVFGIPRLSGRVGDAAFTVRPGVGNFGDESWLQWSHDERASRRNPESAIGANLRLGWTTQASPARNGASIGTSFYVTNLFTVVASGLIYTSYENPADGSVQLAAFDELDGSLYWTTESLGLLGDGVRLAAPGAVEETDTLYLCLTSSTDAAGTVRLLALLVSPAGASVKWTFDTGMHGIATPPAIYNPDLTTGGEEIVYFGVVETPAWNLLSLGSAQVQPFRDDAPEGVFVFAVRDDGPRSSPQVGKWLHPFPDPEIAARTDYPTEPWPAVSGPVTRPSRVAPFPPEDDLVIDYLNTTGTDFGVRGDVYVMFDPHSLGPPVLDVRDGGTPSDPGDDVIDIFVYYTAVVDRDVSWAAYGETVPSSRQVRWQAELAALRDTPSARFPQLKWTANPPPHDPTAGDGIASEDYGASNWDTFFEQQVAPVVTRTRVNDDGTPRADLDDDGQPDEVTLLFAPYESLGYASSGAYANADARAFSRGLVAAWADTSDAWQRGEPTGDDGASRPVEFYWQSAGGDGGAFTKRPYAWSEQALDASGELGVGAYASVTRSADLDVEGETMAFDAQANLLYFVFNHDLWPTSADMESLRVHAVNATTGSEAWRQDIPARLAGDAFNASPSVAGGFIFLLEVAPGTRTARLNVLHGNDGQFAATSPITVDTDADGANLAPTIANDAVYVGTYDAIDLVQRVLALSPNVWLLSTGDSASGRAHRTLALLEKDGSLVEWRERGFSGGGPDR